MSHVSETRRTLSLRRLFAVAVLTAFAATLAASGCVSGLDAADRRPRPRLEQRQWDPFLDELQHRTFLFFWERANPANGLVPDRWPSPSFSSIAAVGFALAAYPVGVERGWITREQAQARVLTTLRFLRDAPQGPGARGMTGYRGFYYHFLDMTTGERFENVELSTVDTAWLIAGVLVCREYFDGGGAAETEIRTVADALTRRVEWDWPTPRPPLVTMGWTPEQGFHHLDWQGLNESAMVYVLGLGSPTHTLAAGAWDAYTSTAPWGSYYGQEHFGFAPLFGHQYTQAFVDFRGIRDAVGRARGIDWFENSRRATLAQRDYAIDNPSDFVGYGPDAWGLTPCDGPADVTRDFNGRPVRFFTYAARGASFNEVRDDGTIAPWAAASSLPFAPEVVIPALKAMRERYGEHGWSTYGFLDAFNPTFAVVGAPAQMGRVVPGVGWFDTDYLGIDQGPIVLMVENHRNGLVWLLLRRNPDVVNGLRRAGFTGGWLESAP